MPLALLAVELIEGVYCHERCSDIVSGQDPPDLFIQEFLQW